MTSEDIIAEVLDLLQRGAMEPEEALCRLIAAGVTPADAEAQIRLALLTGSLGKVVRRSE